MNGHLAEAAKHRAVGRERSSAAALRRYLRTKDGQRLLESLAPVETVSTLLTLATPRG